MSPQYQTRLPSQDEIDRLVRKGRRDRALAVRAAAKAVVAAVTKPSEGDHVSGGAVRA